jgi:outer membrane protein assembly factor BamD
LLLLGFLAGCSGGVSSHKPLPCREQFDLGRQKFERKKYLQATEEFKIFVFNCPGSANVDTAQFFLAMSYFNQKDYTTAAGEFRKLLNSFPTSDFADDAMFMLGLSDYKQSPGPELDQIYTLQALENLQNFKDIYPASPLLPEVEKYIQECRNKLAEKTYRNGRLYFRLGEYKSCRVYLAKVLEEYPDTKWAAQAQFLVAESYRLESQKGEALSEYQKLIDNYPNGKLSEQSRKRIDALKADRVKQN